MAALTSPTLSATSASSYDVLSASITSSFRISAADDSDSDDQIVWSLSDSDDDGSSSSGSGSDFVVLSRPPSPAPLYSGLSTPVEDDVPRSVEAPQLHTPITASNVKSLEAQMGALSLAAKAKAARKAAKKEKKRKEVAAAQNGDLAALKKQRKKAKKKAKKAKARAEAAAAASSAYPSPAPSPRIEETPKASSSALVKSIGLGARPVVDDVSDVQSVTSYDNESLSNPTLYEEASTFISRFLSNPDAKNDTVCRLTLLQSLIIELGLASSNLPVSLKSAKSFLKSHAFLNIREYVEVREQGPQALQKAMYPSRSALIKDIRKNRKNRAPLQWVKEHGLQVLLVGWAH